MHHANLPMQLFFKSTTHTLENTVNTVLTILLVDIEVLLGISMVLNKIIKIGAQLDMVKFAVGAIASVFCGNKKRLFVN